VWRRVGSFRETHSDEGAVILAVYRKPNVFQHRVYSFHTLLGDLATLTRNVVRLGRDRFSAILATPPTQCRALICSDSHSLRRQTDARGRKLYQWLALKRGQSSG
jgi:hypothetical protein